MFTIYKQDTGEVFATIRGRTREVAYAKAERICLRADRTGERLVFDDTCEHGTAYDLCEFEAASA